MADISRTCKCRTAELTRVTTIENEIYIKGQIWESAKIASGAEYRMDEQFKNLLIFEILIIFQIKNKI